MDNERTFRGRGARSDPCEVFGRMLASGDPPPDWDALVEACGPMPADLMRLAGKAAPAGVRPDAPSGERG